MKTTSMWITGQRFGIDMITRQLSLTGLLAFGFALTSLSAAAAETVLYVHISHY